MMKFKSLGKKVRDNCAAQSVSHFTQQLELTIEVKVNYDPPFTQSDLLKSAAVPRRCVLLLLRKTTNFPLCVSCQNNS